MSYNFKLGELKENARYTVSTVDKWDGSAKTEEMSGASLKSFANGCAHLYDIHAAEDYTNKPSEYIYTLRRLDKIGYSSGVYGLNGGLVEDMETGTRYAIIGRCSNLFTLF